MSTFGYHKELGKYEEVDEDELLAGLSSEELQELERELADIDPDDNIPIGLRQKDQTAKTPTANFDREALMKHWEKESKKLLEEEIFGTNSVQDIMDEGLQNKNKKECMAVHEKEKKSTSHKEKKNSLLKSKVENALPKSDQKFKKDAEEEKKDKCKTEPFQTKDSLKKVCNGRPCSPGSESQKNILKTGPTDQNQNVTSDRPSGNPIVIDEALQQILCDDPTMCELNLNNIEDISQDTLLRFVEALRGNTHVRVFALANTHADDRVAFAISKMLEENHSILNLNIESNFVSGRGILALLMSLQHNSTLVELRFHNQRHICGGKVEMEMVRLLRENTTLLKLGYQFDLPGPRMTATSILTRNQDRQRQRRLQEQKAQVSPAASVTVPSPEQVAGSFNVPSPPKKSPCSSKTNGKQIYQAQNGTPLSPSKTLEPPSEHNFPTRKIKEMVKQQEVSNSLIKNQASQKKPKSKKIKNGANEKESTDILKDLRNALKPSLKKRRDEPTQPLSPQRSSRDDLMEAIRGSSIRSLKRVDLPQPSR